MEKLQNKSRRRVLLGFGGVALLLFGGGTVATRKPKIEFESFSCPEIDAKKMRVLVAYTSQYGATAGIAVWIAKNLYNSGFNATAKMVSKELDVTQYDVCIIGSPVISEEWMPEALEFVSSNRDHLKNIPVAYFLSCMTLALSDTQKNREAIGRVLESVERSVPEVKPFEKALFAGAVDYGKMSYFMRVMYQVFSEDDTSGDFRNRGAIKAWSDGLAKRLVV